MSPVFNPMQNPSIELFGVRVDEPITTGTDIIFALVGIIGFFRLANKQNQKHISVYNYFFLGTGVSAMVAGILGHAFLYKFGYEIKIVGWTAAILGTCFAQFGALFHVKENLKPNTFKLLLILCYAEVIIALMFLILSPSFLIVIFHNIFGLLLMVTILEWRNYIKTHSELSKMMVLGVGIAVIAIIFHTVKISISNWFNYMDISHVFMAISLYVMVKGAMIEQKNNLITT
jgi:hypothetical protein